MIKMNVYESKLESKKLNLKMFRCSDTIHNIPFDFLEKKIKENKIDVLRLKISAQNLSIFNDLVELGYFYEIYNINNTNILDINKYKVFNNNTDFSYRLVLDPENDKSFQNILYEVVKNKGWIEYDSNILAKKYTNETKNEIAMKYYGNYHSSNQFKAVLKKGDDEIGVFMGNFENNSFYGTLFGLKEKERNKGYAKYFYNLMIEICKDKGVVFFKTDVNIFNWGSQMSASSAGFLNKKTYFNINLYPLANDTNSENLLLKDIEISNISTYLKSLYPDFYIDCIQSKIYDHLYKFDQIKIKELDISSKQKIVVFHFYNTNILNKSTYIKLKL